MTYKPGRNDLVTALLLLSHERNVCLSNAWIVMKRKKVLLFIVVFRHEERFVGDDPLYLKFWVKLTPSEQIHRFSIDIH